MNLPIPSWSRNQLVPVGHEPLLLIDQPPVGHLFRSGNIAMAVVAVVFVLWSSLAPLSSAVIASGNLRTEGGGRKIVQNLEGGILKNIMVREGQRVRAGQVLVEIDPTQTGAANAALQASYDALVAQDARLDAEIRGARSVAYPDSLLARKGDPRVRAILASSDTLFASRRDALGSQSTVIRERIGQAQSEIASYRAQLSSVAGQARIIAEDTANTGTLVDEGLERRSRLRDLQRQQEVAIGQQGQLGANVARAGRAIDESRAQIVALRQDMQSEAAAQQRDVQTALRDIEEKLGVSRDILARRRVTAPVTGTVVNLRRITIGGVVPPGGEILDIVPSDEPIVVAVRIRPLDIDNVHPGLRANVKLLPFKARTMPMLDGNVIGVGADAIRDEATGETYYEAQISVDAKELRRAGSPRLLSGMPTEVFIETGKRTLIGYFTQPLRDSFLRAAREE